MTKTRGASFVLRPVHDLADEVHERGDASGLLGRGEHFPGVHVEGGQERQGAVTDVFVLDPYRRVARGRAVGRQRPRVWMEGSASTDRIRSPGRSRVLW